MILTYVVNEIFTERIFIAIVALFSMISAFFGGTIHSLIPMFIPCILDILNLKKVDMTAIYDVGLSSFLVDLFEFINLDRSRFKYPVYLAFSRRGIVFENDFVDNIRLKLMRYFWWWDFPASRHWVVIVEKPDYTGDFERLYSVHHSIGQFGCSLRPDRRPYSKESASVNFYGFKCLGFTNRQRLEELYAFERSRTPITFTCQQYTYFVLLNLLWPTPVSYLYGRFTFYLLLGVITIQFLMNLFIGTGFDLSFLFACYMLFDFFATHSPRAERKYRGSTRGIVLGCVSYLVIYCLLGNTFLKFNGYLIICSFFVDGFYMYYVKKNFPDFYKDKVSFFEEDVIYEDENDRIVGSIPVRDLSEVLEEMKKNE